MQKICEFPFPTFPKDINTNDPLVNKIIEIISKIRNKSFKAEEEKTNTLNRFLHILPYQLCTQKKIPQYIEFIKKLLGAQFPEKELEDACLDKSDFEALQDFSKDLCLFDIKIKIIQALTKSSNPDQALDLWLGEFSECLETSDKFSYSFLETGKELFFVLISNTQFNEALILLNYLSMAKEMTSQEVLECFSLLCQSLKHEDYKSAIQEEDQDRFDLIAKNLAKKNLNPRHKGLRKLIDALLAMGKQQTVDLILHSHLTQLKTFENFEIFLLKKPALLTHYYAASLKLDDPSLAIDLFIALINNTKHPLEESDFTQFYEQILSKLKINKMTLPIIEKILSHRLALPFDLIEGIDLSFIRSILNHMNSSDFSSVYLRCWQLLCKVLNEKTKITDNFYEVISLFFEKRTIFKNKETNKNEISRILKEKHQKFLNGITELNDDKRNLLSRIHEIGEKSQLFSKSEYSSLQQKISEKDGHLKQTVEKIATAKKTELVSQISKGTSSLSQAFEKFQKHKEITQLYLDIDLCWKFLDNSYGETRKFFENIYDRYLYDPQENACLFPYLIKKINSIIDNPNYTTEQKISFFHLFTYNYLHFYQLNSESKHKFSNVFSKLNKKINLKILFPERYWEFKLILNSKIDLRENSAAVKQGLFFAVKHLVSNYRASSSAPFKTALELFKYLSLFDDSIHDIHKIYHIFFKRFSKVLDSFPIANTSEIDLLNVCRNLFTQLNQTIDELKRVNGNDTELGSLLISQFASLLLVANENDIFTHDPSEFFNLLNDSLKLSKAWIEHNNEIITHQCSHGEIFEIILKNLEEKNSNDPNYQTLIQELGKHVLIFNKIDLGNKKIMINEILESLNEQSIQHSKPQKTADSEPKKIDFEKETPKPEQVFSPKIENQLLSQFSALASDEKFDAKLSELLEFFKEHRIESPQHINTLFKFIAQTKNHDLKQKAWNFFNSIEISYENRTAPIASFYYTKIWKTILKHNFCNNIAKTLKSLNDNFIFINDYFENSNQVTEKVKFYKDIISWCQTSYQKNSGVQNQENLQHYFALVKDCILKIYEYNEPFEIDKTIIKNLFLEYTDKCMIPQVKSFKDIFSIFEIICLAKLLNFHEYIYYNFRTTELTIFFDYYINELTKKINGLSEHNKTLELKRAFTHAKNLDKIIFPPENSNIETVASIFEKVIEFLSQINGISEYLNLFEWAKNKITRDYEEIETASEDQEIIKLKLIKKLNKLSCLICGQESFNKYIQLMLIYISIVFDLKNDDEIKKNTLKQFCDIFLKKYSLISQYEKACLLNFSSKLYSTYNQDPVFYEILFTIIAVPTQSNDFVKLDTKNYNFLTHQKTIEKLFNEFLAENSLYNFIRCVSIAKCLFPSAPEFSKSLYLSIIKKFQTQLFCSLNNQTLFEIIYHSLAGIDSSEFDAWKDEIFQSLFLHTKKNYDLATHNDEITKFLGNLNNNYYRAVDKNIIFTFINHIINIFQNHLTEQNFVQLNKNLNDFFKTSLTHKDSSLDSFITTWTNWLKYIHCDFISILKVSPIESLGGHEAFQSLFSDRDLQIEAQYYCESLEEISDKSIDILVKKIESAINNDSFPTFSYLCRDTLNYLINNQLDKAILLFNALLKDKRFEFEDRVTYAYYICDKLEIFSKSKEKLNLDADIDFSNFFHKIENIKQQIPKNLINLFFLLDKKENIEFRNKLIEFADNNSLKFEDKIFSYFKIAFSQWKENLYTDFQETIHKIFHAVILEKPIKIKLWDLIFNLVNLSNSEKIEDESENAELKLEIRKRLNEEVIKALSSCPATPEESCHLWLSAFQKIGNSNEFLSLLCDQEKVNFLFKIFDPVPSLHKQFCKHFITHYIKATNLIDRHQNKVENLTQVKSQIMQKFSHLEKEIARLILELDLKILKEKNFSNPDNSLFNLWEFLETYFDQIQYINETQSLSSAFDTLTRAPKNKKLISNKIKKIIVDKLLFIENTTSKFDALLCLTNKFYEKKLLLPKDYKSIIESIDSLLYELLIKKINVNPNGKIDSAKADKFFHLAFTYTRYFYKDNKKLINIIKILTLYSLKEFHIIGKGSLFENRMGVIFNIIKYNEQEFAQHFLDVFTEFYYRNKFKPAHLWFEEFFNYIESNIKGFKKISPFKYWSLKILAGVPIPEEKFKDKNLQNDLYAVFQKLMSYGFSGILNAIQLLKKYNAFLSNDMLIEMLKELIRKFNERITSPKSDSEKKLVKKGLINLILWFTEFLSNRQINSIKGIKKIVKNLLFILNLCATRKVFEHRNRNKFHHLIYILVDLNIHLTEKFGMIPIVNFEEIIKLLTQFPELYPVENPEKEIYGRVLMRFFVHFLDSIKSIQGIENEEKKKKAFSHFWKILSLLQNEKLNEIIASSAYAKDTFKYLTSLVG